jgi:hypothetical protein
MVLCNKLFNYQLSVINAVLQYHRHKHQNSLIHKSSIVNSDLHDLVPSAASEECTVEMNLQHPSQGGGDTMSMNTTIPKERNKLRKPASLRHH